MKIASAILILLTSIPVFATIQIPDKLIFESDTLYIDVYPFGNLMDSDSTTRKKVYGTDEEFCISTGCWRGHVGTWELENDSLFLIHLESGCEDFDFPLEWFFPKEKIKNSKVFVSWFSGDINISFGEFLAFDVSNWTDVYSKSLESKIINGEIKQLKISKRDNCEIASIKAQRDFYLGKYSFHSLEFFPPQSTYTYVLNKYYNIKWHFTDSLKYYACYDSIMEQNLKTIYGNNFLDKAKKLADSLVDNSENWISNAEFIGGERELLKFFSYKLQIDFNDTSKIKTKIFIEIEIDSTGKAVTPIIRKGINDSIDKKVIEIINQMPKWKPAYLYGKPIKQKYFIPLRIDFQ